MDLSSTWSIVTFLQNQGYLIMFVLMIIEGPVITAVAAFASSLGLLNVYVIFLLSALGNLIPDIALYSLGRSIRGNKIESYLSYWGLNKSKIKSIETRLKRNAIKTLIFVKLTPPFPIPGLILTGFAKIRMKKFIYTIVLFNLISALIFTIMGYFLGQVSVNILKYLNLGEYLFLFVIVLLVILYFIYKKVYAKISKRIEGT